MYGIICEVIGYLGDSCHNVSHKLSCSQTLAVSSLKKMTRKLPRPLGSLRNPPPPPSPPSLRPDSFHFLSVPASTSRPAAKTKSLSVYLPTHFPPIRHTSFFPTLMVHMPSSSSVDKLPKCPDISSPSYSSSKCPPTPPNSPTKVLYLISCPPRRELLTATLGRSKFDSGKA